MNAKGSNTRIVWIAVFASVAIAVLLVLAIGSFALGLFKLMDNADAHRCGLALVQKSPEAIGLLGSPIQQKGLTGGSSSSNNGTLVENLTFTVAGPLGEATVEANGTRSQLDSHLDVRIGRDGRNKPIYSGPFDCPALHERPAQ